MTKTPLIFLKMDTQGYDKEAFAGMSSQIPNLFGLQSELSVVPLYEGMPHYTDTEYEAAGLFVVNRDASGRVIEYDCLMAKL